jgi:hypothetical protein
MFYVKLNDLVAGADNTTRMLLGSIGLTDFDQSGISLGNDGNAKSTVSGARL